MKISYLSQIPFFCEGVFFTRGTHYVSDQDAQKLVKNPIFNIKVRKGHILFSEFEEVRDSQVSKASYSADDEKIKIDAIKNALDMASVQDLVKDEKSSKVLKEAEKKLEELENSKKKQDEKKSPLKKAKDIADLDDDKKEAFKING